MAAATVGPNGPPPREIALLNVAVIPLTITLTATTYTSASGGIPFDIAEALNTVGPFPESGLNPSDVYFISGTAVLGQDPISPYLVTDFALGTPTYTAVSSDIVNPESFVRGVLATAPCTARLFGTGSGSAAALGQIGNADLTGTMTVVLMVARSGHNA